MSENSDNRDEEIQRLKKVNRVLLQRVEQMTNESGDSFALFEENVTLRRKAAAERERLSHAIDQSGETVVITDPDGNIVYANPAFEHISGYRREEVLGQNPRVLQSGIHSQAFYEDLWNTIQSGQTWSGEITNRSKAGALYTEKATISPVLDEHGKILNFVAVKRDVSAEKAAAEQLMQANRDLQETTENARELAQRADAANQAKSEFLANMSHEIRTPMNGILGMTQLLLDTPLDKRQQGYFKVLQDSAASLLTLLDDILDLARVESGHLNLNITEFDLRELLDSTLQPLAVQAEAKGLEFHQEVSEDVPRQVCGDAGRVRQILTNLVANAIKFTKTGHVACRVDLPSLITIPVAGQQIDDMEGMIRFAVRDTGIGIPEEAKAQVFAKFYQVDSSITRSFGGTGLGLSIAQHLVERMEGRIGLESTQGEGSCFWFALPLLPATPHEQYSVTRCSA